MNERAELIERIRTDLGELMDAAIDFGLNGADYGDEGEEEMNAVYKRIIEAFHELL